MKSLFSYALAMCAVQLHMDALALGISSLDFATLVDHVFENKTANGDHGFENKTANQLPGTSSLDESMQEERTPVAENSLLNIIGKLRSNLGMTDAGGTLAHLFDPISDGDYSAFVLLSYLDNLARHRLPINPEEIGQYRTSASYSLIKRFRSPFLSNMYPDDELSNEAKVIVRGLQAEWGPLELAISLHLAKRYTDLALKVEPIETALFDQWVGRFENFDDLTAMLWKAAKANKVIGDEKFVPAILADFVAYTGTRASHA